MKIFMKKLMTITLLLSSVLSFAQSQTSSDSIIYQYIVSNKKEIAAYSQFSKLYIDLIINTPKQIKQRKAEPTLFLTTENKHVNLPQKPQNTNSEQLLVDWYNDFKQELTSASLSNATDSTETEFTDSIYFDRLSKISAVMDLTYNEYSRRYIDYYMRKKNRTSVGRLLGRCEYYIPMFEPILDAYGVPDEMKYLPIIESAMNPKAVSRAGATGLWQFIYSTGRMHNLEISTLVDERIAPVEETYAAAIYLSNLYKRYNDWTLVLAAYNCGPGNVNKAIKRAGGKTNYWDIYNYLPRETRNYVPAFIGAVYLVNYYKEHNISVVPVEHPTVNDTVIIKNQHVDFYDISKVLDISVETLKELNPQYKREIIPAAKRNYPLTLPLEYIDDFIAKEDSIYNFAKNVVAQKTKTQQRAPQSYTTKSLKASAKGKDFIYYTIKSGDNFWAIAQKFEGVTCKEIMRYNNLNPKSRINPGDVIKIPVKI